MKNRDKKIKRVAVTALPAGEHTLIFRHWDDTVSKVKNPMLKVIHTPASGAPEIPDHLVYTLPSGWYKFESFLNALGVEVTDEFAFGDLDDLIGQEFRAITVEGEYNGLPQTRIEEYISALPEKE
jgi:hypothetical protein